MAIIMQSIHIIFASTSGHTEYVVEAVATLLRGESFFGPFDKLRTGCAQSDSAGTQSDGTVAANGCHVEHSRNVTVELQRAELAQPEDFARGDLLILASGTWNTGGIEGQMNTHMHDLLLGRAKDSDLAGKPVAIIALGDDRYFYTCRSNEHMRRFILDHHGTVFGEALLVVNEPYGQEGRIRRWTEKLLQKISTTSS